MIALLRQVADAGNGNGAGASEAARWAKMRMHRIDSPMMTELGYSSKLNAEWEFFRMLRDEGRDCAERFLTAHANNLGVRSTLDLDDFLEHV